MLAEIGKTSDSLRWVLSSIYEIVRNLYAAYLCRNNGSHCYLHLKKDYPPISRSNTSYDGRPVIIAAMPQNNANGMQKTVPVQEMLQNKTSPSRFGRIGSQFFQKTVSWVSRSRSDRQAKLGESNKFYYDEKLKRWVEEGAEPPEEVTLPPPPKITSFQNGTTEYNINNALKNQNLTANRGSETKSPIPSESSGIPPMSPSPSQFSARRMGGVRSRYVDTFNKGSDSLSNSFQSPSAPAAKPAAAAAKFFVPAAPSNEDVVNASGAGIPETGTDGDLSTSLGTEISFNSPSPPPPPSTINHRKTS
ncbi:hypothetical protein KFK09_019205 [Dendrobium nobile]|uniref:Uncharacterized protein n=1 Tax=Dendrobium nobile TaxID=94219 RepID=A0A8T3AXY0_DENNO|nr:hypothetical protein KFK09_019205 [Dendrobium nobile]